MSLWQDAPEKSGFDARSVDVLFRIQCQQLPVDHAQALADALLANAPWIDEVDNVGIHSVHVAGSQNGWERPDPQTGEPLILSKRTRLRVRIPQHHAARLIDSLNSQRLTIDNEPLEIVSGSVRKLDVATTLFARHCSFTEVSEREDDESAFTQRVIDSCENAGFSPNKILCGKSRSVSTLEGPINCRSVMIAEVPAEHSIELQDQGLGHYRLLGCGILIPHKDTAAVN